MIRPVGAEGVIITWTIDSYTMPVKCAMIYWTLADNSFENGTECTAAQLQHDLKSRVLEFKT